MPAITGGATTNMNASTNHPTTNMNASTNHPTTNMNATTNHPTTNGHAAQTIQDTFEAGVREDLRQIIEAFDGRTIDPYELAPYVAYALGIDKSQVDRDPEWTETLLAWMGDGYDPGTLADYVIAYIQVAEGQVTTSSRYKPTARTQPAAADLAGVDLYDLAGRALSALAQGRYWVSL